MRKEGSIHSYGPDTKSFAPKKHIDAETMTQAQKNAKEQPIYKAKETIEDTSRRRLRIVGEIKKMLPELKNSQAIAAFDNAIAKNPETFRAFSEAKTQEDYDAIASKIAVQLERELPVRMPELKPIGETSPNEGALEMPPDEDELTEISGDDLEPVNEPTPKKAMIGTAYGGHVAEALARGETLKPREQTASNSPEETIESPVSNIDRQEQRQKVRENAVKIAQSKIEAGMDPADLKETLEGELEELEADIEALEDDEPVTLDNIVTKAEGVRAQIKWLESQTDKAA